MNVNLKTSWFMECDGQELTLISKALTCTLKPGERKAAHALAVRLADMRARETSTQAQISEGALRVVLDLPEPGASDGLGT